MKKISLALIVIIMISLSGCNFESGDDLLRAPKPPVDYVELQEQLSLIQESNMKYAPPKSGENRYAVQLIDIDGDGEEEVLSFFRSMQDTSLFRVYMHKKIDGLYVEVGTVEGYGLGISAVYYPRAGGTGERSVVICWQQANDAGINASMTVCRLKNDVFLHVFDTSYTNLVINDLDGDTIDDFIVFVREETTNFITVRFLEQSESFVTETSETVLSSDIKNLVTARSGYIYGKERAIFVESNLSTQGMVTDILTYQNGAIKNITIDEASGVSEETLRSTSNTSTDIDGDGTIEVPTAVSLPGYPDENGVNQWMLLWKQFDREGNVASTLHTYHVFTEKWFLYIPDAWFERVTTKKNLRYGQTVTSFVDAETGVMLAEFAAVTGSAKDSFTGDDRYQKLADNKDTSYFVRISEDTSTSDLYLSFELIKTFFHTIPDEWTVSELI